MKTEREAASKIADYLKTRLNYLNNCWCEMEEVLETKKDLLAREIDQGVCSPEDEYISNRMFHINFILGNTHRCTMIAAVNSFLEETLKLIAGLIVKNPEGRPKKQNWLSYHVARLRQAGMIMPESLDQDVRAFQHFIALRNCIVHAWGDLRRDRSRKKVEAAADAIGGVVLTADERLFLNDEAVAEAFILADSILSGLLESFSLRL